MEDEGSYRSLRCHIVHMSLPSRLRFIHVHEVIGALASSAICTSSLILQFHWSYLTWLLYLNIESLETDIDNLDMIEDSQEHKYVPQTHCTYIAATQSGASPHVAQRHGQFFHLKGLAWGEGDVPGSSRHDEVLTGLMSFHSNGRHVNDWDARHHKVHCMI